LSQAELFTDKIGLDQADAQIASPQSVMIINHNFRQIKEKPAEERQV